ncbi:hypothetical protein [Ferrimonas marina]|uniref:Uncharacterized protein n=1 Tax=Ferrimonas marina TaxID=299255 RepID=A0A1M5MTQ2_9GAMM|nr:hypothetical protein [Ferrimonas marina]SHG80651.1 hypothetical protein SAMN02745129_0775 [Ferrimonas marina]
MGSKAKIWLGVGALLGVLPMVLLLAAGLYFFPNNLAQVVRGEVGALASVLLVVLGLFGLCACLSLLWALLRETAPWLSPLWLRWGLGCGAIAIVGVAVQTLLPVANWDTALLLIPLVVLVHLGYKGRSYL